MLSAQIERWPIAGSFTISRGAKTQADGRGRSHDGGQPGAANACPIRATARPPQATLAAMQAMRRTAGRRSRPAGAAGALPPGAARNALDCACWDLEAKKRRQAAWNLLGRPAPQAAASPPIRSRSPRRRPWRQRPRKAARRPLLKIKLGGDDDRSASAPSARPRPTELIVDANEGWTRQSRAPISRPAPTAASRWSSSRCRPARRRRLRASSADPGLRRRERARPRILDCLRRQIRRGQHQARQDRRPDRGARHARRRAASAIASASVRPPVLSSLMLTAS